EKRLVLDDRPAESGAVLIASERGFIQFAVLIAVGQVEDVSRVKIIIAQKFERIAVKLIAAGASGDVDDGPGVSSVLGAVGPVADHDLPYCADRGLERNLVLNHVVQVDAVDHEVDRVFTIACRVERERALTAQRRGQETVLRRNDRAGNQQSEIDEMASVEWNLLDGSPVDHLADGDRGRLDDLRVGGGYHSLGHFPGFELGVLDGDLADFERQIVDNLRGEALRPRFDLVYAWRQRGCLIIAVVSGLNHAFGPGCQIAHGDLRAGDYGPRLFLPRALDPS